MPAWLTIIASVVQIVAMVLKNKFEQDAAERARKDALHTGWAEVIKSGDTARINEFLGRLRT